MNAIAVEITDVQGMLDGITNATDEQKIGIAAVNTTIVSMDDGTQENAALVEQTAAAAEALKIAAKGLSKLVSQFKAESTVVARG